MNRNAIERALEKYAGHKDPTVRADLALWGPLLLEAADISQALRPSDIRANEPTNKELDQAVRGGPTLLSLGLVKIEEAAYADALKRLAAKLLETLKREGRKPLPIRADDNEAHEMANNHAVGDSPVTFHGQMPLWVCFMHNFYPVQTGLYPSLVRTLIYERPVVPHEEISEFLDRVWTRLPSSELYEPQQFLREMEPVFQPATYNPKLFLDEEGSLLTLEIDNIYETRHGEFSLNGPNPDFQTGSYTFEGQTYLVRRHQEEENDLLTELASMGFQARSNKLWFLEPEEAIAFLLDQYPALVEKYRVYGERALSRYKMRTTKSTISAEVVSNEKEKWFSLEISVDYDGQSLPLEKIWKAWTRGKRYVQLKDGSYTSLPEAWLEKLAHKLTALGLDPSKPPQQRFKQFEAPVLDSLLEDLPGAQTDSFWNNLREKIRSFREVKAVPAPRELNAELRSYQLQGLAYLNFLSEYGFGGILADEMGLGKTVQTLAFIAHMIQQHYEGPNLIVVPTSVLPNWEREAEKFVPHLRRLTIYGTRREGMFKHIAESDLIITTYALLRRDLEEMEKYEFNTVILDEAQNIKNPNTITARAVRRIRARMRLCLSGTPIENNLFDNCTVAVSVGCADSVVWYNTVRGGECGVRAVFEKAEISASEAVGYNILVAKNQISGAKTSVLYRNASNSVLLSNELESADVEGCINIYVCENTLTGTLRLINNNYLIANRNASARLAQSGNANQNGDTVTDLSVRELAGANEELLPHINSEQFVGMERRAEVRTLSGSKPLDEYIADSLRENKDVIVPPGCYIGGTKVNYEALTDVNIYAYGVYEEFTAVSQEYAIQFKNCKRTAVYGLFIGYSQHPHIQGTVTQVRNTASGIQVTVVPDPGYIQDFRTAGNVDGRIFSADSFRTAGLITYSSAEYNAEKNLNVLNGCNVWAALEVARREENAGKTIVTFACDTGERYLSTELFA